MFFRKKKKAPQKVAEPKHRKEYSEYLAQEREFDRVYAQGIALGVSIATLLVAVACFVIKLFQ